MKRAVAKIRFSAKLVRPASPKGAAWTFLVLPKDVSVKLPTRGQTTVNGHPFQAALVNT